MAITNNHDSDLTMSMTMTDTMTCMAQRDQDFNPSPFQSPCFVPTRVISEKAEQEQGFVMLPYWLNYWKECCLWPWLRLLRGLLGHISDYPNLGHWLELQNQRKEISWKIFQPFQKYSLKSNKHNYLENISKISRILSHLPPFHIDHSARLNIFKLRTMDVSRYHRIVDL